MRNGIYELWEGDCYWLLVVFTGCPLSKLYYLFFVFFVVVLVSGQDEFSNADIRGCIEMAVQRDFHPVLLRDV